MNFIPIYGQMKLAMEIISGTDMVTVDEVSRGMLLAGLLAPSVIKEIPSIKAKGIKYGDELYTELKKLADNIKFGGAPIDVINKLKSLIQNTKL